MQKKEGVFPLLKKSSRFLLLSLLLSLLLITTACAASPKDGRIVRGKSAAPITIIEYTDFQCPYCAQGARTVSAVMARYEGKVKLVVKHYPLPFHPAAMPAALYFEAIALQSPDKAWQYYDLVFANPQRLTESEDFLKAVAAGIGVDMQKLERDARSPEIYKRIAADMQEFQQAGYDGVPAFVINGKALIGAQPAAKFVEVIDELLKK